MEPQHDRRRRGTLLRTWARHPRWALALKAALAAAIAWAIALVVPGPAGEYPYYAPLGAVIATSTSLAGSAKEALQTVAAILLGAGLALLVDALAAPNLVTIAFVVAAGVLLAGWSRLGSSASWVPTAALFTLIIGSSDPVGYVMGYAGLTLLGAAVGLAVTAAFPPLPLAAAQVELSRLRDLLAEQLDMLAGGLERAGPPSQTEWHDGMRPIDPVLAQMRSAVELAEQARRGNRRARHYRQSAERQYEQARALGSLAFLVEELTQLVIENEVAERDVDHVALGPGLRPPAAVALRRLAAVLRSVDDALADPDVTRSAYTAVDDLLAAVHRHRRYTGTDLLAAGSLVLVVQRSLAAVIPQELAEEESPG
ncbi:Uncharacterized membrane protein YgaE, UPF0421/DUF939 family [Modestobacter sp. DSM 44400]|uniref:hypothetical protein n=1 Tax=Modestobacter sp. DSM 44400 TaxID=1550230 RepID=UPI000899F9C5|nr:hypothetical protein [Modestobacter sp. DSM 44400]SDY18719.1 Uncharacterized membrane protein YgaE, UPF0421/DUF939 family [Modestobacter sp. DSM 44400]